MGRALGDTAVGTSPARREEEESQPVRNAVRWIVPSAVGETGWERGASFSHRACVYNTGLVGKWWVSKGLWEEEEEELEREFWWKGQGVQRLGGGNVSGQPWGWQGGPMLLGCSQGEAYRGQNMLYLVGCGGGMPGRASVWFTF